MTIYDKNKGVPGAKKRLWIAYPITEELRVKHGLKERRYREPSPADNERAAKAFLAQRNREVREGSWRPPKVARHTGRTLTDYVQTWIVKREGDRVKSARDEKQRLRDHVLPVLGGKLLHEITRRDVGDLIASLQSAPSKASGKMLAPRTVHRVYEDLRTMFNHVVEVDELLTASPCSLKVKRGELPKKKDKDPRWRAGAVYTREEVELLISDERIHPQRRMLYGLMFLMGVRVGEAAGRRWRDYDARAEPLHRMSVATQYDDQELKMENPREVPVHPVLAAMLASWKLEGFVKTYGRAPTREDFIVPKQNYPGRPEDDSDVLDEKRVWHNLQVDLETIGLRRRRSHDMRRTLITLARADGADESILRWITHGPTESMMDLYTTPSWPTLCAQISCLKLELHSAEPAQPRKLRKA